MAGVKIENVTKRYGKNVVVIEDLNLTINDGDFFCLLGPSGCGKSTTLRMIAGLEEITGGVIKIGDRIVNDIPPEGRNIAMVFETYALYPHFTVFENIAFNLRIRKIPEQEIRRKVESVAEVLEMNKYLSHKVDDLGDGQKQRVSICRALVRDPEVFLMDEPISHLDATLRAQMRTEIKRLQKEEGATYVYVTHDQMEAMALADRIAIMNFGVVQQVGSPTEVYNNPSNKYVAGFVGEPPMNLFECDVSRQGDELSFVFSTHKVGLPDEARKALDQKNISDGVFIGIRPSDMSVSKKKPDTDAIKANIYTLEPRGDGMIITVKAEDELIKVDPPLENLQTMNLALGDECWLILKRKKSTFLTE